MVNENTKFVGRANELDVLENAAARRIFQMVVVYGRRRIGKTALIAHFCKNRRTLWFTAKEQSSAMNLREFSQQIFEFFDEPGWPGGFPSWSTAFERIAKNARKDSSHPFVFVFDEFPYAAAAEPGLASSLQIAIDHQFEDTNMMLILCGSNEGFMESRVLGSKSPLYGRRTAQIHLRPFDIFDASKLMPSNASWLDRVHYYATLGGTPYYLKQLDASKNFEENIESLCFNVGGILYEEPMMLMRQELREPMLYNSVIEAVGSGKTKPKAIAEQAGMDKDSVSAYLRTLESLGLVERNVPLGENPARSRKGLWTIKDPFFAYWYRFVSPRAGLIDMGQGHAPAVYGTSGGVFETYVGQQFERMCMQWLFQQSREGKFDFLPTSYGKWWGNDPVAKQQTDIDVVMADDINKKVLLGECKWRESFNVNEAAEKLIERSPLITEKGERLYFLFSKLPVRGDVQGKTRQLGPFTFVDAETMFG
ncbi:MAG: ATP-binding protein [Bifidobacterium sp.]|nr:ATP-binding protein [Bifidobacterium sp.]